MNDRRSIVIVEEFPQSPAQVWGALIDPVRLGQWLMPNDFVPVIGHEFTFRTSPIAAVGFSGVVAAKVIELIPEQRLAFKWGDASGGNGVDWTVTFTLEPAGSGTRLTLVHDGFEPSIPTQRQAHRMMSPGWAEAMRKLADLVDES